MSQTLERKDKTIEDLRRKLRALKRYARQLKYLAEDNLRRNSHQSLLNKD